MSIDHEAPFTRSDEDSALETGTKTTIGEKIKKYKLPLTALTGALALGALFAAQSGDKKVSTAGESGTNIGTETTTDKGVPGLLNPEVPVMPPSAETIPTPSTVPEISTPPTSENSNIDSKFLPAILNEGEFISLPKSGTPEELVTAFSRGIASSFSSLGRAGEPREDALAYLFDTSTEAGQLGLGEEESYLQRFTSAKTELEQSFPGRFNTMQYARVANVTRVNVINDAPASSPDTYEIYYSQTDYIINGSSGQIIAELETPHPRVSTFTPGMEIVLPNGSTDTGYLITSSALVPNAR